MCMIGVVSGRVCLVTGVLGLEVIVNAGNSNVGVMGTVWGQ